MSYANLKNDANANYALFTMSALGGHTNPVVGQDVRQFYVGLRHAFRSPAGKPTSCLKTPGNRRFFSPRRAPRAWHPPDD